MKKRLYSFMLCFVALVCNAQDIHWSQPANALLYINPAFTGIEGPYSVGLNYRDQWRVASKPYQTYMAAGDVRFNNNGNVPIGLGGIINRDVSADGRFKTTSAGLTLSCLIKAGSKSHFGAGIGFNYVQNALSNDTYSWGNQYQNDAYNPEIFSGEAPPGATHHFFDLTAGVSYNYDGDAGAVYSNGSRYTVGYSISHLTQPNVSFTGYSKLALKHSGFIKGIIPMGEKFFLVPTALVNIQGPMMEIVGGVLLRRTIGQVSKVTGNKKGAAASIGLLYRHKNSFIPTIEIEKSNKILAISYDITAFGFSTASKRGGLELALRIRATKKPPSSAKKHGRPKHGGKWF